MNIKPWIEAVRLRTLPVSIAGVMAAWGYAVIADNFQPLPGILCLLFALLAQIASNFANEYFDFKDGLDKAGRVGPRRGVTEGDITPRAMLIATLVTMFMAAVFGLSLIHWGGWLLLPVGLCVMVGLLAYSTGPFPLSRNALGEVAVIIFFGLVPVNFTYYLFSLSFNSTVLEGSIAIGLMAANILMVNNYRDLEDDKAVGKITLANKFGRETASWLYLLLGLLAVAFLIPFNLQSNPCFWIAPTLYVAIHILLWLKLRKLCGAPLNPLLGLTAINLLLYSLIFLACAIILQP